MNRFIFILSAFIAYSANAASDDRAKQLINHSTQMMIVSSSDWDTLQAKIQRFERKDVNHSWEKVGEAVPVVVGKNGLAWAEEFKQAEWSGPTKKEGDGKSPAGVFTFGQVFGFHASPIENSLMPYLPIKDTTMCIEDSQSKYYTQIIDANKISDKDWNSVDRMIEQTVYEHGIVVNYNMSNVKPEHGSCIFFHIWRNKDKGTLGCTAMEVSELKSIISWLNPASNPILVQLPISEYQRIQQPWLLPPLMDKMAL